MEVLGVPDSEVFLDSDDLMDLRDLLEHVKTSDVLLLFQTKSVLQRPWCLLELYTAIQEGVPIVPLQIAGLTNYEYEFAAAQTLLENLEVELEKVNPGAGARIVEYGVPLAELQKTLLDAIPMLISKRYEPSASANVLDAQLEDIVLVMEASVAAEDKAGRDGAEP